MADPLPPVAAPVAQTAQQGYPQIQGTLPWQAQGGAAGALQGLSGTPQQVMQNLGNNYANAYNASLSMNQQNYQNILQGYQQTAAAQQQAFGGINDQYHNLYGAVNKTLTGADQAAQQQIVDLYAQQQGNASQSLANAGLGNTTVTSAVNRGLTADESKAQVNLADQFAQLRAGYKAQIGQASLGFDQQAAMANSGLAQNQLGWMNSVNAGYPDASMYANLAQQYGMFDQANQDRALLQQQYANQQKLAQRPYQMPYGGGGVPGLGYSPRGGGGGSSGYSPTSAGMPGGGPGYQSPAGGRSTTSVNSPASQAIGGAAGAIASGAEGNMGTGIFGTNGLATIVGAGINTLLPSGGGFNPYGGSDMGGMTGFGTAEGWGAAGQSSAIQPAFFGDAGSSYGAVASFMGDSILGGAMDNQMYPDQSDPYADPYGGGYGGDYGGGYGGGE